ncbi:DUF5000 domain-containing lipoprotein [Sunxiuqinia sp. A32]|uniref:DUF5000 domain-containing lipoprotein n=1 Tax=Sunxiuqinia sp. A32 TaxID=3461496 RepID=UPI0040452556
MKYNIFIYIVLGFFVFACNEEPIGQQPLDQIPPGPVSDVKVENTPGGAILTYTLPTDEDLLYVKAVYSLRDGVESEVRSSLYKDTLKIAGFGDMQERQVKLIAVDRSRNESQETVATINPLEPTVITMGNTLNLVEDFGGVHGYWENPTRAEVSVVILKEDNNKEYVPIETFYSTMVDGEGTSRGMDTIPANFGIYVQDRWENQSETKYFTLTPIYETMFDRLKFKVVDLPGDAGHVGGWEKSRMFDGEMGNNGYSSPGGTGVWPHSVTIDLGVTGKLSRLKLFQRLGPYIFSEGNLRKFEVWGCQTLDPSGDWDSWTKMMDCTSIKPSGLPILENSNEDIDRAVNGEDFINSPMNPAVRYIRILVNRTWQGGDNFQISELQFFGDNR